MTNQPLEASELQLLFNISQMLDRNVKLEAALVPALEELGAFYKNARVALSMYDPLSDRITIAENAGLSQRQQDEGSYKIGEGITGKVYKSGEPVVVRSITEEENFLDRTIAKGMRNKERLAFICVPIMEENQPSGTLSMLFEPDNHADELEKEKHLLVIVASLIAKASEYGNLVRRELAEKERLQKELRKQFNPANMIGSSKKMQDVYRQIQQVSQSDTTVLLRGESGVGKELVAHAIHYSSQRSDHPFIGVNCAAFSEELLKSELFGHEKGAFTGAVAQRKGVFEQASGGTLFLDEIGDISPAIQVALLRVLQERSFERLGGTRTIKTEARIVAATNRPLEALMQDGTFRLDLYYRLNVFPINIPPLRERRVDLTILSDHFIKKYNERHGKSVRRITSTALQALMLYEWPGNVRELENFIERAVLVAEDGVIRVNDLPPTLQTTATSSEKRNFRTLKSALDSLEKELITEALIEFNGNMTKAAKELDITERIMGLRVKKYRINPKRYRPSK
jgi:Nif-specific regulatory protein